MNLQESIRRILREETEVIPSFILRRIGGYVNNILLVYGNYNLKGNFKNLIDEISDVIINDLVSDYMDSIDISNMISICYNTKFSCFHL